MDWGTIKKSSTEWDLWALIAASLIAIVLHLLHLLPEGVIVTLILLLIALHALHEMGHVVGSEETAETVRRIDEKLEEQNEYLVDPHRLRQSAEELARRTDGEFWWFNPCPKMFRREELFDVLLKPAVENPGTEAVRLVVDAELREEWRDEVEPKVDECRHSEKVDTSFVALDENVAFTLADVEGRGEKEGQISVWGEPFMMEVPGAHVPRHVLHLKPESSLVPRLVEMFRKNSARDVG